MQSKTEIAKQKIRTACKLEIKELKRLKALMFLSKNPSEEQKAVFERLEISTMHKAFKAIDIKEHFEVKDELPHNGYKHLPEFFEDCLYGI